MTEIHDHPTKDHPVNGWFDSSEFSQHSQEGQLLANTHAGIAGSQ